MKTSIMVAATLATLAAMPALAQDAGTEKFNGPFIGAQLGTQWDRQSLTVNNVGQGSTTGSGLSYGGQAGYDFKLGGSTVLGVEVGVTGRTGRVDFTNFDLKQGRTFTTTARLGFMPDSDSLLYARGGYSNARFTAVNGTSSVSDNRNGWTIGAGYERYLASNVSARLEYNYSDFGKDNLASTFGANSNLSYKRHALTAGVNFRF
jgi:outer membrane immunogenic protein